MPLRPAAVTAVRRYVHPTRGRRAAPSTAATLTLATPRRRDGDATATRLASHARGIAVRRAPHPL